MIVNDGKKFLTKGFEIGKFKGIHDRQPFTKDQVSHFHRHPLRKVVRVDVLHIAVTEEIAVCMKIDRVEWDLLDELYQAPFIYGGFPQDLVEFAAAGKLKRYLRGFHC